MARKKTDQPDAAAYDRHKDDAARRQAAKSLAGRDIGELPAVADPARKEAARLSFRDFCDTYFRQTFTLPWSRDHLKAIGRIEAAVLRGGLFALAMPRGSGKTTLCEVACVWAVLYGHRSFVCLIGSDETSATQMLDSIKTELETNELLAADFPEVCHPVACLEGIANRCAGQLHQGKRTHITWTAKEIVLPTVAGSPASGAILKVAGITGRIRGMKHKRVDGKSVRPDLVVIDDPQTDESAWSPSQCATRERILAGAVLGLAGPGKKIAGVMPCTVIRPGDMADNILDKVKHPEWNGERCKLVYRWPDQGDLWQQYGDLRADGLRKGDGGAEATAFYAANREAMDAGAEVAWPERHNPDELSALQHAYNLKLLDEHAFAAEYQNEPLSPQRDDGVETLTAAEIAAKVNGMGRGLAPVSAVRVTAFVDVQKDALYWAACAWQEDFTGFVLDYGSYPDQRVGYFALRDLRVTLADRHPGGGVEAAIYAGLAALTADLLGRSWRRDDGAEMRVERCLIDANWSESTDTVYLFCRQSPHSAALMPSHGKGIGAGNAPMGDWARRAGDRAGSHWRIPPLGQGRAVRHVTYDTNFWKSFVHARLAVPMGGSGCLSLFGDGPARHRMFADHLTAEYAVRVEGRGRKLSEWKLRPEKPDNHLFDCVVGCAVAASVQGCALPDAQEPQPHRRKVSFAEMQRQKRGRR